MNSFPNENILKLRELTKEISKEELNNENILIIKKLKAVVDSGKKTIDSTDSPQSKIKCYESMCTTITNLLNQIKTF